MSKRPSCSIIIPTLGRPDSLKECLESIRHQTFTDYEIILVEEEGALAKLRNEGARRALGDYLIFIDDDTIPSPDWLKSIHDCFKRDSRIVGVSGPSFTTDRYRLNRDIFRFRALRGLHDLIFMDGRGHLPGHITKAGCWTAGATDFSCNYDGPVHFLEACNMSYRSNDFWLVGGFDEQFKGVGDWSEPDLAFRLKDFGGELWFSRDARLEHRPSKSGAFKKRRRDSWNRMDNYERFARRWIKPHWKHAAYKLFLRTYYWIKSHGLLETA